MKPEVGKVRVVLGMMGVVGYRRWLWSSIALEFNGHLRDGPLVVFPAFVESTDLRWDGDSTVCHVRDFYSVAVDSIRLYRGRVAQIAVPCCCNGGDLVLCW